MAESCSCAAAGWCERHRMMKTAHMLQLCQTRDDYRTKWDEQAPTRSVIYCGNWQPASDRTWRCPRCEKLAGADSIANLPKQRACVLAAPVAALQSESAGCGGCNKKPAVEMPPMTERIGNFFSFLGDYVTDPSFVSKEEAQAAAEVCEKCEQRNGHFCGLCGCWIAGAVRAKAKHCPLGKWERDKQGWQPYVHARLLGATGVVIPCYGKTELTTACVTDCLREGVRIVVVDNKGDYQPIGSEDVLRGDSNEGWARACNAGIEHLLKDKLVERVVLLNNDTRLSANFFAGLIVAEMATRSQIVHASMNVGAETHRTRDRYSGSVTDYQPRPIHKAAGYTDGTAVSIHRSVLEECGSLDTSVSPKHGWNLLVDLCIRAKDRGFKITITEAAYVEHLNMQTAKEVCGSVEAYVSGAMSEAHEGMERKWGQGYMELARQIPPPIAKRNLIYHITPFAMNDVWLRNVRQILKRIDQFNGKRVVAIATGERMVDPEIVKQAFGDERVEFLLFENSTTLRETVSTLGLLDAVKSTARNEATFYAHAKGVATAGDPRGVTYWRNAMYHELLDDPEKIAGLLETHPMVGCFRKKSGKFPDGTKGGDWHFAGTYWWFRHDAVFGRSDWREKLPQNGWGTEAYPGVLFGYDQVASVFGDEVRNPYDPNEYAKPIEDDFAEAATSGALRIELGGGKFPLGHGYLNVDRDDCADIKVDFDAEDFRLPFDDDSVADVYSSHCLEHVRQLRRLMRELLRVCLLGARIEIRVPHWNGSMAMCYTHVHTIAEPQIDHWCNTAVDFWFGGLPKKLKYYSTEYVPSGSFEEAKRLHPGWTDEQVMRFVPDACHEIRFIMHVQGAG